MQQQQPIALHVAPPPSFTHTLEVFVEILARTDSGETQALAFAYLATAVELALSPAKLATEEPTALALLAMREPFFITSSVSILALQVTGEIRLQILVRGATTLAEHASDLRTMNVSPVILDTFTLDSVSLLVLLDTINMQRHKLANLAGQATRVPSVAAVAITQDQVIVSHALQILISTQILMDSAWIHVLLATGEIPQHGNASHATAIQVAIQFERNVQHVSDPAPQVVSLVQQTLIISV